MILADKGFPDIKTSLDESGKQFVLVMPPCLRKDIFTADEVVETKKIAGVRIHIEQVNQRIKIYRILSTIPTTGLSYVDNIVFMACVLVNLQPPIFKDVPPQ